MGLLRSVQKRIGRLARRIPRAHEEVLKHLSAGDLAGLLMQMPAEGRAQVLQHVPPADHAQTLLRMPAESRAYVLQQLPAADPAETLKGVPTEELAEMLAQRLTLLPGDPMHDTFYRYGFHLLRKHYYLPIPDDTDRLDGFWNSQSAMVGVNTNDAVALDLIENALAPHLAEFRGRFPTHGPPDPLGQKEPRFHLINGSYMAVDADMLYGLIRHFRPRRIIEVGIGNSTLVAIAACAANRAAGAPETRLTSIDPYPRDAFRDGFPGIAEIVVGRVQDVPLARFEELAENDILFIDSSHVLRSGNDVHFEYMEVLPRLKPGVLVHIHDVSLPRPYPKVYYDSHLYWNEQYLLQAFLAFNARFEVLWPGNHMMLTYPERMHAAFPTIRTMRETYPSSEPTAFWMRAKPG